MTAQVSTLRVLSLESRSRSPLLRARRGRSTDPEHFVSALTKSRSCLTTARRIAKKMLWHRIPF